MSQAKSFFIIKDNSLDAVLAGWTDATTLSIAAGAGSDTPAVAAVSTAIHRLVWGNFSGVGSASWDLGALAPVPGTGMSQANDVVLIGAVNTETSNVVLGETAGCE